MKLLLAFIIAASIIYADVLCKPVDEETKFILLEEGDMAPTVLDCEYNLDDTESFHTLKWFRNDKAIYQWIRGSQPAPIPDFKNYVDSSYESSKDPNKQYSSLALINPTISSTGDYKCIVQTQTKTIVVHKSVQVIDVRNYTLSLKRYQIQNETQLECKVSNVFPKPKLTIESEGIDITKVLTNPPKEDEDGYFNATTFAAVYDNDDDTDYHKCIMTFDGYPQNFTVVVASGSSACERCIDFRLLLISCLLYFWLERLHVFI
ncbi:CG5597 [Drosophila busckii]|uniref:CG5597 n=1 Tax=Drosophila busckii TaxID=30019 RepID=A0A0M4EEQ7_DROBS|nr:uncharacterized protein LOC108595728 [Drosophila busckii]ALC42615.1 CG5597 [Drosophila busckii]